MPVELVQMVSRPLLTLIKNKIISLILLHSHTDATRATAKEIRMNLKKGVLKTCNACVIAKANSPCCPIFKVKEL
jgi:hypothetical protein